MIDPEAIVAEVLKALGAAEMTRVRSTIGSSTLGAALQLILRESEMRAKLFIPHYWALFYHDGHPTITPKRAQKLVFFDDPQDDPRLNNGVQVERKANVRRLTRAQYLEGLRRNQERRAAGARPFMYVVDSVGPQAGNPFFTNLAVGAAKRADPIVARVFGRELRKALEADPATKSESKTASFDIG